MPHSAVTCLAFYFVSVSTHTFTLACTHKVIHINVYSYHSHMHTYLLHICTHVHTQLYTNILIGYNIHTHAGFEIPGGLMPLLFMSSSYIIIILRHFSQFAVSFKIVTYLFVSV